MTLRLAVLVPLPFNLDLYENDPAAWGASLVNNAELLLAVLDAAKVRSVIEVGAYAGNLTQLLLLWAEHSGARIVAIDLSPQPELEQLARDHAELELVREPSLTALAQIEPADAVILDGDHNYYTVTEELRLIVRPDAPAPLVLLHDVCWPHARRDDYYDPSLIPAEYRQPIAPGGGLHPLVKGVKQGALPYHFPAATEGGPRNGVLTALEDFVSTRDRLQYAVVPAFYGLGVLWSKDAPDAVEIERILQPWDRNPVLERLESNRVLHLASSQVHLNTYFEAQERLTRAHELFDRMLDSRAFAAAELFLRVRQRGHPIFSREQILRLMNRR